MPARTLSFPIRPVPAGLLALAAAAALGIGVWPLDRDAPPSPPAAPVLDLSAPALPDTGAALARPLFDPLRRAWTARGERDDLTALERPRTNLSVRGILIAEGGRRALIAEGTSEPAWLSPGEVRGAWRLVSIAPTEVVVADAVRRYTLAFLGAPVALQPVPRHPPPPPLRPALEPADSALGRAPPRRIAITPPAAP